MKYFLYVFLILSCCSCNGQENKFEIFKNQLKEASSGSKNITVTNKNITVTKPIVSDKIRQSIIDRVILKEIKKNFCDNQECQVKINFELGHNTDKLLSIKETANSMYRIPRDLNSINFFNFMLLGKNELYEVKINITQEFKTRIKNKIRLASGEECKYLINEDTLIDLFIDNGISYAYLYNDEICNIKLKFDFRKSDLIFRKLNEE